MRTTATKTALMAVRGCHWFLFLGETLLVKMIKNRRIRTSEKCYRNQVHEMSDSNVLKYRLSGRAGNAAARLLNFRDIKTVFYATMFKINHVHLENNWLFFANHLIWACASVLFFHIRSRFIKISYM